MMKRTGACLQTSLNRHRRSEEKGLPRPTERLCGSRAVRVQTEVVAALVRSGWIDRLWQDDSHHLYLEELLLTIKVVLAYGNLSPFSQFRKLRSPFLVLCQRQQVSPSLLRPLSIRACSLRNVSPREGHESSDSCTNNTYRVFHGK